MCKLNSVVILICLLALTQTLAQDSVALLGSIKQQEEMVWGNFPLERTKANNLYREAMAGQCQSCQTRAVFLKAKYLWADGYYDEAVALWGQSKGKATKLNDIQTVAECSEMMATAFYYQAYYDSALKYYNQAFESFESIDAFQHQASVLHLISMLYHRMGNFQKTIEFIYRKEEFQELHPEVFIETDSYGGMGALLVDTVYYRDKIANDQIKLNSVPANDFKTLIRLNSNLAKSYSQLKQYRMAANYLLRAARLRIKMNLRPEWHVVGVEYALAQEKDSAFYFFHKAKAESLESTRIHQAWVDELLGNAHLQFNRPDSALLYYDRALKANKALNNRLTMAGLANSMATAYFHLNRLHDAEAILLHYLPLASEIAVIHEKNLLQTAQKVYTQLGNYQKALQFQTQYLALQDSINRQETAINLTRLQAVFQLTNKRREVMQLQQENQLNRNKIEARNLQIGVAGLLVALIGLVTVFYFIRNRENKKMSEQLTIKNSFIEEQNRKLKSQNQEKEVLMAEIHHRVKNNLQIISSLISIKAAQSTPETAATLQQIHGRVFSMGLVHEQLYQADNLQLLRLDLYIGELSRFLVEMFSSPDKPVALHLNLEHVALEADKTMSCGLICNELITNSIKHAFDVEQDNRKLTIEISQQQNNIILILADNGTNANKVTSSSKSFGMRFVDQLVKSKLAGQWIVELNNGTVTQISFPA